MSDRTEPEAERPARIPMDIGQLIVDRAKPVLHEGGYAYEGPLVAEKWTRLPGGDFLGWPENSSGGTWRGPTAAHGDD
jgi:hypothetical protein